MQISSAYRKPIEMKNLKGELEIARKDNDRIQEKLDRLSKENGEMQSTRTIQSLDDATHAAS